MGISTSAVPRSAQLLLPLLLMLGCVAAAHAAVPARVVAISPVAGARWVRPATSILVRFDHDAGLDRSALSGLVTVTGSVSGVHAGRTHVTRDGLALLFDPVEPFALGEHVEVAVAEAATAAPGTLGAARSFAFEITPRLVSAPRSSLAEDDGAFFDPAEPQVQAGARRVWPAAVLDTVPADFPDVNVQLTGTTAPGQVFMATFGSSTNGDTPYLTVLNNFGDPLWFQAMDASCFDFKPQDNGQYTYYDGSAGHFVALDSQMAPVDSWACGNGYTTDVHELRLLPGGHALLLSYDPQPVNMSTVVPGGNPNATVTGLVIQELDADKNVVFQWRSWDHFEITDCVGINLTRATIDYVHGNALELDGDGNILLSSRHMNEITKIDRISGAILWRWGGIHNQFTFTGDTLEFTYQHAIRRIANGHYTLFDNGNLHTPHFSRACEYALDVANHTANLVWSFRNTPDSYGSAMGYVQRLDNGNTLVGFGIGKPDAIEVNAEGEKVMELTLPAGMSSYRSLRATWETSLLSVDAPGRGPELSFLGANPIHGSTILLARLPHAGTASVTLYDLQGRAVNTPLEPSARPAGLLSLPVSFAGRASGVYFCRVQLDGQSVVRRLVVAH